MRLEGDPDVLRGVAEIKMSSSLVEKVRESCSVGMKL